MVGSEDSTLAEIVPNQISLVIFGVSHDLDTSFIDYDHLLLNLLIFLKLRIEDDVAFVEESLLHAVGQVTNKLVLIQTFVIFDVRYLEQGLLKEQGHLVVVPIHDPLSQVVVEGSMILAHVDEAFSIDTGSLTVLITYDGCRPSAVKEEGDFTKNRPSGQVIEALLSLDELFDYKALIYGTILRQLHHALHSILALKHHVCIHILVVFLKIAISI